MRSISRPVLLAAAGCGLLAAATAPAAAKTCPSGQFLQVSKGKCISMESARELGISHAGAAKAKSGKTEARRATAGESTVAKSGEAKNTVTKNTPSGQPAEKAGEAQAETTLASAAPVNGSSQSLGYAAAPAETYTVRRNIAPFGALQFGGFK